MLASQEFGDTLFGYGLQIDGIDHAKALSYVDVLKGGAEGGKRVAIIGAGGIGFDVAEFLGHSGPSTALDTDAFMKEWGVDQTMSVRGGLVEPEEPAPARQITLCQRKPGKLGANLGKTTGWIHRATLKNRGVTMLASCSYTRIDDKGLHLLVDGQAQVLEVDHVVVCAGQVPARALAEALQARGVPFHLIGGADGVLVYQPPSPVGGSPADVDCANDSGGGTPTKTGIKFRQLEELLSPEKAHGFDEAAGWSTFQLPPAVSETEPWGAHMFIHEAVCCLGVYTVPAPPSPPPTPSSAPAANNTSRTSLDSQQL